MSVHQLKPSFPNERAKPSHPPDPSTALQAVHGQPCRLELTDQSVLPRKQIRDFVGEAVPVQVTGRTRQQLLRAATTEPLDQEEDPAHDAMTSSYRERYC
jgi:hypothetical protein